MFVYVTTQGGDYRDRDGVQTMAAEVCTELAHLGHRVFRADLAYADLNADRQSLEIDQVNQAAMAVAAGGVAFSLAAASRWEVSREICLLTDENKPVLVVTDAHDTAQLRAWEKDPRLIVVRPRHDELSEGILGLQALMVSQQAAIAHFSAAERPGLAPLIFETVGLCPDVAVHEGDGVMGLRSLLPSRGYHDDAGFDLVVSEDTKIPAGAFVDVPSGVKVDLPEGTWGMIIGRSSTLRTRALLVNTGVIDAGWTGPLFTGVQNLSATDAYVKAGDRLAQLIVLPAPAVGLQPTWGLVRTDKSRGEKGFGSTGS